MKNYKDIKEGSVCFSIPDQKIVSKQLDVFYNPKMKLNRSLSIALLESWDRNNLQIALPLAGTGIRALRFVNELPAKKIMHLKANDYNPKSQAIFEEIAKKNSVDVSKVLWSCKDANIFLRESKGFDYIDIDPFGSPNFLLDSAILRLSRGGLLSVTATDTAALAGTYPSTCKYKYWATCVCCPQQHELALRILIRKIQLVGMQYEKALFPVLSYHKEHYYRVFFRVIKQKKACIDIFSQQTNVHYCPRCARQEVSDSPRLICVDCNTAMLVSGPLFAGKLHDASNLQKITQTNYEKEVQDIINQALQEEQIDALFSFDPHTIAKKRGLQVRKTNNYITALQERGFQALQGAYPPTGIKTTANFDQFLKVMKELSLANPK